MKITDEIILNPSFEGVVVNSMNKESQLANMGQRFERLVHIASLNLPLALKVVESCFLPQYGERIYLFDMLIKHFNLVHDIGVYVRDDVSLYDCVDCYRVGFGNEMLDVEEKSLCKLYNVLIKLF